MQKVIALAPVDPAIRWSVLYPFSRRPLFVSGFLLWNFSRGFVASQSGDAGVGFEEPHLPSHVLNRGTDASPNLPHFCIYG